MALASLMYPAIASAGADSLGAGALLSAGSAVLGRGNNAPAGPSRADSGASSHTEAVFNNSGWVVNFGEGATVEASNEAGQAPGLGVKLSPVMLAVLVGGALLLWKLSKK